MGQSITGEEEIRHQQKVGREFRFYFRGSRLFTGNSGQHPTQNILEEKRLLETLKDFQIVLNMRSQFLVVQVVSWMHMVSPESPFPAPSGRVLSTPAAPFYTVVPPAPRSRFDQAATTPVGAVRHSGRCSECALADAALKPVAFL